MSNKSSKLLAIILILAVAALVVSGCGKSGNRFDNELPSISITSFEGWTPENIPANIDTLTHEYDFQQRIYWHATDPDGIITGYAFRILDENREPIASPGYQFIASAADDLIPDELLNNFGDGWVIHYLPSADQSIALDDPEADRSIWTNQKYAVINFPAANDDGEPMPTLSYFEVVAMDNRGGITPVSAWRKFRTNSKRPVCNVSTTKGNPNGGDVGSGITLRFSMSYPDSLGLLIDPIPYKYEFKMMKVYDDTGDVVPDTETDWISTENQLHINEFRLTRKTDPVLEYDYNEETGASLNTRTRIIARAIDLAGVYSEFPSSSSDESLPGWDLQFKVKPGFRPHTLLYQKKILALGDNHFEDRGDDSTPEDLPFTITQNEQHFATPLFKDTADRYTLVHSNNLKVYIRWGWWGEYGKEESTGTVTYPLDNPYEKKVDTVLSEPDPETGYNGGENYFGEITHFDVRYDDQPYNFPPFADSVISDEDGTQWLRLPLYSPLRQSIVLTGNQITPGEHKFEVRCVDSQDEVSEYPAVFYFTVLPYVAPASRSGVLIIDDDPNHNQNSPDALVTDKYANMTSDIPDVTVLKYGGSGEDGTNADVRKRNLAFPDLQNYKMVIYHADNPSAGGTFEDEIDGLSLYVRKGGNLVISHTSQFASKATDISNKRGLTLLEYMGFPSLPTLTAGPANPALGAFFQNAVGSMEYPDLGLQYSAHPDNPDQTPSFHPLIENLQGYSAVAYHNIIDGSPNILGEPLYTYGCKPVDYPVFPPSQAQFDARNGKVVGVRKVNSNGARVFTFTFPLSYMLDIDTKALINEIWNEIM